MSQRGATVAGREPRHTLIADLWLWAAYLGPPGAWSAHLLLIYLFVSFTCRYGGIAAVRAEVAGLTVIVLLIIAACGWIAYRHAAEYGANIANPDEVKSRSRGFLAHSGVYMAALFFIATLFEAAPAFALNAC